MLAAARAVVVVASTVVFAGLVVAASITGLSAFLVLTPVAGAFWLLVLIDSGYRIGREWAHRRRRRASRAQRDAWTPGADVRPPIDYAGVLRRPSGNDPVDHQGDFRAVGIRLAVLPALAVLFLTVQTVFLNNGESLAIGFILAECLLLVAMIWTIWTGQEPSRPWVVSRMRGEVFRREMFLLLAGVGPYLGLSSEDAERVRDARLNVLSNAEQAQLDELNRFADRTTLGDEHHWQDEVWRRNSPQQGPAPDVVDRMRTYLDYRIRRQALFMELSVEKCERTERSLGRVAKAMVLAGIAVALCYAALLLAGPDGHTPSTTAAIVALLAAGLPPLCNAVLAIQNLFAAQRLAASYRETRQELLGHENTLRTLLSKPATPDAVVLFRALAVRVELTLAEELRRWRIIVVKPEFDAGL
ncbi:hypothetical protein [Streptomyces sp. NBC_00690]|uniref:hypothetical protein n=1 Tax=Streptomyces sp. NBC_00690 TaxID=2975808 RepID=UPI002E2B1C28|nr:hypothetical protein [Streptomyces sp. NBC_00690]